MIVVLFMFFQVYLLVPAGMAGTDVGVGGDVAEGVGLDILLGCQGRKLDCGMLAKGKNIKPGRCKK